MGRSSAVWIKWTALYNTYYKTYTSYRKGIYTMYMYKPMQWYINTWCKCILHIYICKYIYVYIQIHILLWASKNIIQFYRSTNPYSNLAVIYSMLLMITSAHSLYRCCRKTQWTWCQPTPVTSVVFADFIFTASTQCLSTSMVYSSCKNYSIKQQRALSVWTYDLAVVVVLKHDK